MINAAAVPNRTRSKLACIQVSFCAAEAADHFMPLTRLPGLPSRPVCTADGRDREQRVGDIVTNDTTRPAAKQIARG